MSIVTAQSESLRAAIASHRDALDAILRRYAATNPRMFGSVARGDAGSDSDIDLLVDLVPEGGNELLRVHRRGTDRPSGDQGRRGDRIAVARRGLLERSR